MEEQKKWVPVDEHLATCALCKNVFLFTGKRTENTGVVCPKHRSISAINRKELDRD
jgi:hypothetical protein